MQFTYRDSYLSPYITVHYINCSYLRLKLKKCFKWRKEFIYRSSRLFLKHHFHNQSSIGKFTWVNRMEWHVFAACWWHFCHTSVTEVFTVVKNVQNYQLEIMNGSMDCRLSLILSEHMIFESVEITNIHLGLLKAF